jgi:hypothetical protein
MYFQQLLSSTNADVQPAFKRGDRFTNRGAEGDN